MILSRIDLFLGFIFCLLMSYVWGLFLFLDVWKWMLLVVFMSGWLWVVLCVVFGRFLVVVSRLVWCVMNMRDVILVVVSMSIESFFIVFQLCRLMSVMLMMFFLWLILYVSFGKVLEMGLVMWDCVVMIVMKVIVMLMLIVRSVCGIWLMDVLCLFICVGRWCSIRVKVIIVIVFIRICVRVRLGVLFVVKSMIILSLVIEISMMLVQCFWVWMVKMLVVVMMGVIMICVGVCQVDRLYWLMLFVMRVVIFVVMNMMKMVLMYIGSELCWVRVVFSIDRWLMLCIIRQYVLVVVNGSVFVLWF